MEIKYEVDYANGSVSVDDESVQEAFADGGRGAVEELLQEEVDRFVANNVCAVVTDSQVDEALKKLGLG